MGYYNLFYILRNIVFNFRKIFKYITISFLSILFIAICLLLISSNKVNAEVVTYPTAFTSTEIEQIESVWNDYKDSFDTFTAFKDNNDYLVVNVFNSSSGFKVYRTSGNNLFVSNQSVVGQGHWIKVYNNGTRQVNNFTGNTSNTSWSANVGNLGSYYYLYGNILIYDSDQTTILWQPDTTIPPTIENFNNQNVINSMIAGEYFDIVVVANDYINTPILFEMNNGSLQLDDERQNTFILLDSNSPYLLHSTSLGQSWQIPKSALIPIYNNCDYNFSLSYGDNFAEHTQTYSITTDFSALGESMSQVDTQDATQNINDFLHNNNYDSSSITSNMPSNDLQDPTSTQVDNIFNMIRNAFNLNNAQPVVFHVPNTDEDITIPADLVTSKIPQPILILIQGFYWYIICRFIIKDISKVVEHAKSGEILDAKDGNIKTELL